ncbi:MAG: hypothetical protein H0U57_08960 [Tatlockia sp.]|nr:hypothetical protein [Tatlockia sp.]
MADPIKPEDAEVSQKVVQQDSPEPKPQAPLSKVTKKLEEEKNLDGEEEDSGYKMLDIAWKAFDASKGIHSNLAGMVWDNVLKDPYEAAKTAVKDKVSELGTSAWNAAGDLGSAAIGKASEAAYDLRDFMQSDSPSKKSTDVNEFELDELESDDDEFEFDDESGDELELEDFAPDDEDAEENEIEEEDANWAEPEGIPMTSMQKSTSPNPAESSKSAASQQGMPKTSSSSSSKGQDNELVEEAAKGLAL